MVNSNDLCCWTEAPIRQRTWLYAFNTCLSYQLTYRFSFDTPVYVLYLTAKEQ